MADCITGRKVDVEIDDADDLCRSCAEDGHHIKATSFCKDCDEFLCYECNVAHTKPLKMEHHLIVSLGNAENDHCTEECTIHTGRNIAYFCTTHEELGCAVCNFTTHKTCKDVVYIPDTISASTGSLELTQLMGKLETLNESVSYNQGYIKTNFLASSEINKDVKTQNATLFREITELIEKKKTELDSEVDARYDEDSKKLKELDNTCTDVAAELAEVKSNIKKVSEPGQQYKLYINMKRTKRNAALIEEKIRDIEKMNRVQ